MMEKLHPFIKEKLRRAAKSLREAEALTAQGKCKKAWQVAEAGDRILGILTSLHPDLPRTSAADEQAIDFVSVMHRRVWEKLRTCRADAIRRGRTRR